MKLVIMGPIGVGKGTQAKLICEKLGIVHISTGDIMRKHIKEQTPIGVKIKSILDNGGYVDDVLTTEILRDRLDMPDTKNGFILDGYPRTVGQADSLESIISINNVIFLTADRDVIVKRLSGRRTCGNCGAMYHVESQKPKVEGICDSCGSTLLQREDDKEEIISNRLKIFEEQTLPLKDFYEKRNLLAEIDGTRNVEIVTNDILEKLKV